jgi:cytochrome c-type biogenesis protein
VELGVLTVFVAGLLTLATPCILPMLPIYFTLLLGEGVDAAREGAEPSSAPSSRRWRLVLATALFVAGLSAVFTLLGMAASSIGSLLQAHRAWLLVAGGALILILGLRGVGLIRIAWLDRTLQPKALQTGSRLANAFLFGVVFALGWTPCVGPVLGSVLTFTAATSDSPATGALYLFVYSLGVGLPLLTVSWAAEWVVPRLRKAYRHLPKLERVTGGLMVAVGLAVAAPGVMGIWSRTDQTDAAASASVALPQLGNKPRLIEFYAQRCPVCARMKPLVDQLRLDCLGHEIEVVAVDISQPENAHLAEKYAVHAVPAFVLLDERGNQAGHFFGSRGLGELRAAAAGLIATSCAGEDAREELPPGESQSSCKTATVLPRPEAVPADPSETVECSEEPSERISLD